MANLNYLYRSLQKYQVFRNDINNWVRELQQATASLDLAKNYIVDIYQYDNASADNYEIRNIASKLDNILISLESNIMPSIDAKIRRLERQIADEEAKEALNLL